MMIQQIEHKYSEEHIMESTTVNKKNMCHYRRNHCTESPVVDCYIMYTLNI